MPPKSRRHESMPSDPEDDLIPQALSHRQLSKNKASQFLVDDTECLLPPKGSPSGSSRAKAPMRPLMKPQSSSSSTLSSGECLNSASEKEVTPPFRMLPPRQDSSSLFLLRPHTITLLVSMLLYFLYIALLETVSDADFHSNTKHGLLAVFVVFQVIGMLMLAEGPFIRPHPIVWKFVLSAGIIYLLILVFFLFQSLETTRYFVSLFDPALGVPLEEANYATDCSLTWDCIKEKLDFFVFAHAFGWFAKALILRDTWILWIISVMFEVMEYSLVYQLPNFEECWWDHWILDVLVCNAAGIYCGMKVCKYFQMKTYDWRAADFEGQQIGGRHFLRKFRRTMLPDSWAVFNWGMTASFKNYLVTVFIVFGFLIAELNAFYLKHLLWIPPNHTLNWIRVVLIGFMGLVSVREVYEYFSNPKCKRLGSSAWIMLAIVFTEVFLIIKFGKDILCKTPPVNVTIFWAVFLSVLVLYPFIRFYLFPRQKL